MHKSHKTNGGVMITWWTMSRQNKIQVSMALFYHWNNYKSKTNKELLMLIKGIRFFIKKRWETVKKNISITQNMIYSKLGYHICKYIFLIVTSSINQILRNRADGVMGNYKIWKNGLSCHIQHTTFEKSLIILLKTICKHWKKFYTSAERVYIRIIPKKNCFASWDAFDINATVMSS